MRNVHRRHQERSRERVEGETPPRTVEAPSALNNGRVPLMTRRVTRPELRSREEKTSGDVPRRPDPPDPVTWT